MDKCFLGAQGYKVRDIIVHQDNQSVILLENNGQMSSSKHIRHIDIQYIFVTNHIKQGNIRVAYCPTDDRFFYETPSRNKVSAFPTTDNEFD
jgi:hypothetical protein